MIKTFTINFSWRLCQIRISNGLDRDRIGMGRHLLSRGLWKRWTDGLLVGRFEVGNRLLHQGTSRAQRFLWTGIVTFQTPTTGINYHARPWKMWIKTLPKVGDGNLDHAWVGRPEDMTMARPSMKIDANNGGSDLAGETAAAMASTAMLFKDVNQTYADELIQHAKELFQFADQHRKAYHESIPNAASFYR